MILADLLRRRGQVLTLIECKFSQNPIGLSVVQDVQRKVARRDGLEYAPACDANPTERACLIAPIDESGMGDVNSGEFTEVLE